MDKSRWMVASAVTLFALACSSPAELYLMSDEREKVGEAWKAAGGGCILAISPNAVEGTMTGGTVEQSADGGRVPSDDYVVEEQYDGQTVHVTVRSGGDVVAERRYDAAFLATGDVDVIDVTTKAGRQYQLKYWGGATCDASVRE